MGGRGASSGGRSNYKDYENSSAETVNKAFGNGNGGYSDQWVNSLNEEQYSAIDEYTTNDYIYINSYWRGDNDFSESDLTKEEVLDKSKALNSALNKYDLKFNAVFHRGDDGGLIGFKDGNITNIENLVGKTVVSDSFLSTSAGKGYDRTKVYYNIKTRKGKGIGGYIAGISYADYEREFLFNMNSAFKVTDAKKTSDGKYVVDLEYLGKKPFNIK